MHGNGKQAQQQAASSKQTSTSCCFQAVIHSFPSLDLLGRHLELIASFLVYIDSELISQKEIMSGANSTHGKTGDGSSTPSPPPHMQILDELEAKARGLCGGGSGIDAASYGNIMQQKGGPSEEWTLADDARLASFVQEFTAHIQRRAESIASAVLALENKKDRAAAKVELAKSAFLALPDQRLVQQVVVDGAGIGTGDDSEEPPQQGNKGDEHENQPSTTDEEQDPIQKQQKLEDQAIKDGMKGLKLFYDPAQAIGTEDHYFGLDQGDDSACYYESAPADAFNQRPLPFVVGSREFMESRDAGLGEEYGVDDDEAGEKGGGGSLLIDGMSGNFLLDKSTE